MNSWKVILATILIFGAGVLTGSFITQRQRPVQTRFQRAPANPEATRPNPWFVRKEFLRRMDQKLQLAPEQHERIARILEESQERTRALMRPITPQMQAEVREVRQKIRAQLTPDQVPKFEELLQHNRPPRSSDDRKSGPRPPGAGRRGTPTPPPPSPEAPTATNELGTQTNR